ncbi:MAG: alpha-N-arabinofuranosidase, partial [Asticcacaulis sp.]|nr:alpha-N-arabinofuranosidase [Asticcacaulis sp.]
MTLRLPLWAVFVSVVAVSAHAAEPVSPRFNADPSPHVFKGRIYLYATNDQDNSG